MSKQAWAIAILSVALVLDNMLFGMIAPIIPLYATELGATSTQLGLLMACFPAVILIVSIPMGVVSDKIGRRPMILSGLLVGGLSSLIYAMANSLILLLVTRCVQGFSTGLIYSSCFAYVADTYPPEKRGGKIGFLGGMTGVGLILGPVFGGVLADLGGKGLPFLIAAALFLISFSAGPYFFAESRQAALRREPVPFRIILGNFNLVSLFLVIMIVTILWGSLEVVIPLHASAGFGGGMVYIGTVFGIGSALFCVFRYAGGWLSDVMGRRKLLLLGIFFLAQGALILALVDSLFLLGLALSLVFFAYGLFFGVALPLIMDIITYTKVPGNPQGTASALYNFSWSLSLFLGASLGGGLFELVGFYQMHVMYAVSIFACLVWAYIFCREPSAGEAAQMA